MPVLHLPHPAPLGHLHPSNPQTPQRGVTDKVCHPGRAATGIRRRSSPRAPARRSGTPSMSDQRTLSWCARCPQLRAALSWLNSLCIAVLSSNGNPFLAATIIPKLQSRRRNNDDCHDMVSVLQSVKNTASGCCAMQCPSDGLSAWQRVPGLIVITILPSHPIVLLLPKRTVHSAVVTVCVRPRS